MPIKEHIEYVKIHPFPEGDTQMWKMQYYVGEILHHGRMIRMGQAMLDGNGKAEGLKIKRGRKAKKKKIINFNGFVTDWLSIKQCRIIGHDVEFFNFISPPKKRKEKKEEFESLQKLLTWQKNNTITIEEKK